MPTSKPAAFAKAMGYSAKNRGEILVGEGRRAEVAHDVDWLRPVLGVWRGGIGDSGGNAVCMARIGLRYRHGCVSVVVHR